jgi:hypothetical protein
MDHSLLSASRTTHLKIVFVALVGAILVVVIGIVAHVSETQVVGPLKPTNAVTFTGPANMVR